MHVRGVVGGLFVAMALVSCGDSEDGGGAYSNVSVEEMPAAIADAYCSLVEECAPQFSSLLFKEEECRTLFTRTFEDESFNSLEAAINDGRVLYDSSAAAACINELKSAPCESLLDRSQPSCEAALQGTVARGDECSVDAECEGDSICVFSDNQCPGTCQGRLAAGEECNDDDRCQDGLICSEATGRCATPAGSGEACGGGVEPQCAPGMFCIGEDDATQEAGTCLEESTLFTSAEGSACSFADGPLCQEGLSCVVDEIDGTTPIYRCRPKAASGGTCKFGVPDQCPKGEHCNITLAELFLGTTEKNCEPLPKVGEACSPALFSNACEAYARCVDGTCEAMRRLGESCSVDAVCYSGRCVNGGCAASACE